MSIIPKRASAKEILTGVPLRLGPSNKPVPLFPSIKDIPDLAVASDSANNFSTRFSKCYGSSGVPDSGLNERLQEVVKTYAGDVDLVADVTPEDIADALQDAFERLGTPQLRVVDNLLYHTDLNNYWRWRRVVLISADLDHLIQPTVRDAIFKNLVDAGRNKRTVELRVFLDSTPQAMAYQQAILNSMLYEMQALAPSTAETEFKELFDKVLNGGALKIDVKETSLKIDVARFAVAYFIGAEGTFATNLGPEPLAKDPSSMDLWEDIATQLVTLEPLKEEGDQLSASVAKRGKARSGRAAELELV